ncbi:MAG: hydroxyacid dehydrogenase [Candidatus Heimdallarchaeota archaeon]|nr:hydroxyacid dehydrogenase [Candidatus Heimdallarchaeota archaeon]MCG3253350.1 hydroxyacid dehydrogenase [Candidatus Heimdallarchaeota archaeon]MCK4290487.1 hydroxyacid dehydrogenase [Candidatus Heimdallarchaeota archaeon]
MKVIVSDKISSKGVDLLKAEGYEVNEAWDIPKEDLPGIVGDYDAIVIRSATKVKGDLLKAAKNLKVVGRAGIGLDNVDLKKCEERGITVRNTPNATTDTVAELALAFMFALARKVVQGTTSLRKGEWAKKQLKGSELLGKTLGIVGCGRIGSALARKCDALGMNIIGCDVVHISEACVDQCEMPEVFSQADFISLHLPLLPETKHIINEEAIAKMKDGVFIINCARGGTIDEKALYDAIKSGKVGGSALDVWEKEPVELESSKKLLELDQVIGSPHIGAQTAEGQERAGIQVAEAVIEELKKL